MVPSPPLVLFPPPRYFSITLDRVTMGPVMVACAEGGTSIEDLAQSNPEKIIKVPVDITRGITDEQV